MFIRKPRSYLKGLNVGNYSCKIFDSRRILSSSFLWLFSFYIGLGNTSVYLLFLLAILYNFLKSSNKILVPTASVVLLFPLLLFLGVSFFYSENINIYLTYAALYLFIFCVIIWAYNEPYYALSLILSIAFSLSIVVIFAHFFSVSAPWFLVHSGLDPNFSGYLLVSAIYILLRLEKKQFLTIASVLLFVISGYFLESRSFWVVLSVVFFMLYGGRYKYIIAIFILTILSFIFYHKLLGIFSAILDPGLIYDLTEDHRRVFVLATGLEFIMEAFPLGSGIGPENYIAALERYNLEDPNGFKLGYPHNYFISVIAQGGIGAIPWALVLIYLALSSLSKEPIIAALFLALIFNEYIGLPALWVFIGIYLIDFKNNRSF